MPTEKITEWATIGKIVAPFGLRGQMKVNSLTDIPDRFAQLEEVYLGPDYKPYTIKEVRPYKGDMVLLKVAGITDATAAESCATTISVYQPTNWRNFHQIFITSTIFLACSSETQWADRRHNS